MYSSNHTGEKKKANKQTSDLSLEVFRTFFAGEGMTNMIFLFRKYQEKSVV